MSSSSGPGGSPLFSIAVLCYQAEGALVPFVEELDEALDALQAPAEIVLVANYWPHVEDETPAIARATAQRTARVEVVAEPKQGAMGWDMKAGLDACRGRYVGVVDGDGQFPAASVVPCFEAIASGRADLVKTYRRRRDDGLDRRVVSAGYNLLFRLLFPRSRGCRDVNSKPKVLRREAYERMTLTSTDWFLDAELILEALRLGLAIEELPIDFGALAGRRSFVTAATVWEFLVNMARYRVRAWARGDDGSEL